MAALGTYSYIISGISYIIHIFELHGMRLLKAISSHIRDYGGTLE